MLIKPANVVSAEDKVQTVPYPPGDASCLGTTGSESVNKQIRKVLCGDKTLTELKRTGAGCLLGLGVVTLAAGSGSARGG